MNSRAGERKRKVPPGFEEELCKSYDRGKATSTSKAGILKINKLLGQRSSLFSLSL